MKAMSATPRGVGALCGVVAVAAMTLVTALLRAVAEVPTPAELIGDRFGERVPVKPFLDLIGLVGTYGRLKALSVAGVLAVTLVTGAVLGAVYARVTEQQREAGSGLGRFGVSRRAAIVLGMTTWLAWLVSVALFWPLLASHYRGAVPATARVANSAGLFLSLAVYTGTLMVAYRFVAREPAESGRERAVGRRAFLAGGVGVAAAAASGGVLAQLYRRSAFGNEGLQYNGDIQPITPNDQFYVVTQNLLDPEVARGTWRLEVTGEVDRPRRYDFAAITSLGSVIQESTLACISNGVGGGLMSNAVWKGVPLRRLLEAAGTRPGAVEVVLHGVDGYVDTFPLAKAMDETTLVAYEMNGEPLPRRHGYPVRIIVPGLYGEKNVKWIDRIEVSKTNEKGFYENQGWGPDFTVQTQSRFTAPAFDRPLAAAPMMLRGTAFAGDRGVSKVEVSADDGATWQPATIDYAGTRLTWNLWSYQWTPTRQGDHRLVVRATDGAGNLQTDKDRTSGPEGATGLHKITAKVT